MSNVFYYKDRFIDADETPIPLEERGHQFGDGVYEVVRVYDGRPFLLDAHLDRFERSARVMGLANPLNRAQWKTLIGEAVRRSALAEAQVYWQLTRGIAPRSHTFPAVDPVISLTVRPAAARPEEPVALFALPDDRWANVFVKSINLLPNVLAKETARRNQAAEALYVREGRMLEGGSSNVFLVRAGVLYTAPANRHILGGITRAFVLHLARQAGLKIVEEALPVDELDAVDEIFVTSTTQEILPVREVITYAELMPELRKLSPEAPASLLFDRGTPVAVWRQRGDTPTTDGLSASFAEAVQAFRTRGVMEFSFANAGE